jgi:hypothetical protein
LRHLRVPRKEKNGFVARTGKEIINNKKRVSAAGGIKVFVYLHFKALKKLITSKRKDEREETNNSNSAIFNQHYNVGGSRYSPSSSPQRNDLHEAGLACRTAMSHTSSSPGKRFMLQQRMYDSFLLSHSIRTYG